MIMAGPRPVLARRHFLASTVIGSVGLFLPLTPAHASSTPPPGSQTLSPAPAPAQPGPTPTIAGESSIIGATATFEPEGDSSIRPFRYHATDEDLADLKRRIRATRWPERETVTDNSQGVQLATMQKLADYWANHHDWRRAEAQLFAYPNFITNIDGLDIHFVHVKS